MDPMKSWVYHFQLPFDVGGSEHAPIRWLNNDLYCKGGVFLCNT